MKVTPACATPHESPVGPTRDDPSNPNAPAPHFPELPPLPPPARTSPKLVAPEPEPTRSSGSIPLATGPVLGRLAQGLGAAVTFASCLWIPALLLGATLGALDGWLRGSGARDGARNGMTGGLCIAQFLAGGGPAVGVMLLGAAAIGAVTTNRPGADGLLDNTGDAWRAAFPRYVNDAHQQAGSVTDWLLPSPRDLSAETQA